MNARIWVSAVLLVASGMSWAQRPLVYPLRSQSAGTQSVDNAYCYWQANEQTHVDVAREPQKPLRTEPIAFAPDTGHGASAPPLPAPAGPVRAASSPTSASAPAATAGIAGASATAAAPKAATAPNTAGTREANAASGIRAASNTAATADAGSLGASGGSVGLPPLPPLPPPEPPMTRYWHAYGDCMQSRGYGVR
ncbi:hypothetical protein WKR88_13905 [Trinickia caryophylli]|uniref:Uncharacterized protein n=1 Tax=Trinickia caryophylli TaxID=28094 RepID=A0A1X7GLM9_TRICW|nr:hypothetical protein [Trinickia caryophylli]PMS09174.1 hypothetical protein C0Z17_26565 [Trinickia caryophylli]TRX15004.1 hypothetical protein FNF07_27760 [Trinickia caryophylli]WQE14859.1 hypothetical protein U0034_20090 [Trinickia caryophylli]SMF71593.1 hypothetical protein SAMN06295900_116151 [Trinickia caryophylli]GLU35066.1 hypothetical protein Busp01_49080 [Trinickia caryophylli]